MVVASTVAETRKTGTPKSGVPALAFRHLSKSFGGARALDDVDFSVLPGEVHGLLGQNGSGKSTLIKILAGYHDPDAGELSIYGERVSLPLVPGEYRRYGLGFVHQNLGLVPSLTVLENLIASDLATRGRWYIDWQREAEQARQTFARFRLDLDPDATLGALPQVQQALLAIVRAFEDIRAGAERRGHPGILVLDEPTPFLPREGVERLFELIRDIVAHGASVIFVSHDVDEVMEITDRASVLRDGKLAGVITTPRAQRGDFIEKIIGRRVELFESEKLDRSTAGVAVRIQGLSGGAVEDVSVDIHRGEVVGFTGLIGSGYEQIPYLLIGAQRAIAGRLHFGGKELAVSQLTPFWAKQLGLALLPGDRQNASGVGTLPIDDNVTLPVLDWFRRGMGLKRRAMTREARALGEAYEVRPNRPEQNLESLSGGNQQKVLLAKWLQASPALLLLDEPTQGVDVGARQAVFKAIRAAAEQGTAVICCSSDHEQLAQICDRVLILARGRVIQELSGNQVRKDLITEQCYRSVGLQG
ncbi:MAG: sugar ABC transporter ATP-binding protein [Alphaproteobacteria bacterium]|nr:sugar ABC transporter ATP-binding protein [Alphaproteobacteria bacterium]